MPQRQIYQYFPQSRPLYPSGASFLDLPYPLRRRVYLLAGLVRFCPINLNQEGLNSYKYCGNEILKNSCFYKARLFYGREFGMDFIYSCCCAPLPISLLYVCRAISDEVSAILYSQNKFTISRSDSWGLRPLRNLSAKALQLLQSLTIRLNCCTCVFDYEWYTIPAVHPCHPLCQSHGCHDRPLGIVARQDQAVLREWHNIVHILAANACPQSLCLSIVCDTRDFQTAQAITESLNHFPLLRNCSIRLGQVPDWSIYCLARSTGLKLIGQTPETLHQTDRSLPTEIIEHILSYTELVAPFKLEWCPDRGLVPFDCCKTCTDTLDCCCCSFYHAAHATSCSCWRVPVSLFLVSHKMNEMAMSVFFSHNEFVILPAGVKNRLYYSRSSLLIQAPIIQFLERLPSKVFPYFRSIALVFPDFVPQAVFSDQEGMKTWEHAISIISQRLNLSRVTFTVLIKKPGNITTWEPAGKWLQACKALVRPLTRLKEMPNLFIGLSWPHGQETQYEAILEKSILGDRYNTVDHGKNRVKAPFWQDYWSKGPVFQADGLKLWPPDY